MNAQRYRAAWVFPVDGEPIENGTVEIGEEGRIVAIHGGHDPAAVDLGRVAILPGLVNAHTHLEFSDLDTPLGPREPFTDWIRAVVASRRNRSIDSEAAVQCGLIEAQRSGTTLIGEIATSDASSTLCSIDGPKTVVFRELIGLLPEQTEAQVEIARRHLESSVSAALSPHAPYSVHPELFAQSARLAREYRRPLAMHLAETRGELELLDRGCGPFVEMLRDFGVWQEGVIPTGSRPLDYLRPLGELDHGLVIHGNYLADDEVAFLAGRPNLTVVYCPRTHAFFNHAPHRWQELLERGARVALGTDSRASNPDLSVWRELCFLRERFGDVDPRVLLQLGTSAGARALGMEEETGSLRPGKRADLCVVRLSGAANPFHSLFSDPNAVVGTMCSGTWLHGPE